MIRLILPIIIAGLLLVGCGGNPQVLEPIPAPITPAVTPSVVNGSSSPIDLPPPVQEQTPVEEEPCADCPDESEENYVLKATPEVKEEETQAPVVMAGEPPEDRTWISPGKVQVGNFFPGARAEWGITIHNGADEDRRFKVEYRKADRVQEGFGFAPEGAKDWIIIANADPVLAPKETRDILVVLDLPIDAVVPPKWEFWISVKDVSEKSMITTALCSRWLIYMQ